MKDLSVIMPYCNEWPQLLFTIRSVAEELDGKCDFEIIAVDNYPASGIPQSPDRAHPHDDKNGNPCNSHIDSMAKKHDWLRYMRYDDKLSHWNAKNTGVLFSQGKFLLFLDAHVVPGNSSLVSAFMYYKKNHEKLDGTLHLPLTYHILENTRLIYQLVVEPSKGIWHYRFKNLNLPYTELPFEVPCMSTCGMFMSRALFDLVGGWPPELGIYGGGENFMNFSLALLGKRKWIYTPGTLHHHGDSRGYNWNYDDYHRNRMIALYMHGGEAAVQKYIESRQVKGSPRWARTTLYDIMDKCQWQRNCLLSKQQVDMLDWYDEWAHKPYGVPIN